MGLIHHGTADEGGVDGRRQAGVLLSVGRLARLLLVQMPSNGARVPGRPPFEDGGSGGVRLPSMLHACVGLRGRVAFAKTPKQGKAQRLCCRAPHALIQGARSSGGAQGAVYSVHAAKGPQNQTECMLPSRQRKQQQLQQAVRDALGHRRLMSRPAALLVTTTRLPALLPCHWPAAMVVKPETRLPLCLIARACPLNIWPVPAGSQRGY